MTEKQKLLLLWSVSGVLFVVMIATVLFVTPSPFASLIERSAQIDSSAPVYEDDSTFDINAATKEQWFTLEGMTMDIYLRVRDRVDHGGGFRAVDDLLEIEGVTQELLDLWKDRLQCA